VNRNGAVRAASQVVPYLLAAVVIVAIWEIVVLVTKPSDAVLPPPLSVASEFARLFTNGTLIEYSAISVARVTSAWILSALIAIPLGLLMGSSRRFEAIIDPFVELFRPISPLAWIPLAILWLGIGESGKIMVVFVGTFFPLLLNTIAGVKHVDPTLLDAGQVFGCTTRWRLFRRVVLPAALPGIVTGLRIAFGTGWAAIIAAELVAARSGLGYLIANGMDVLRADEVLVGMIAIGILGVLFDLFFRFLHGRYSWDVG
jgi:ABC-type nitrate/sulfonate/bicarbonate transport system permease component